MKYIWLLICLLFAITTGHGHAETAEGEIQDAEFIIEKQKKHTINQAQRLFFKAPTRIAKKKQQPLTEVQTLDPATLPFDPAATTTFTFHSAQQPPPTTVISPPLYNITMCLGLLQLPSCCIELMYHLPFKQGNWSLDTTWMPYYYPKRKGNEGMLDLQSKGKYKIRSLLLEPALHYQHTYYTYNPSGGCFNRMFHHGEVRLNSQHITESALQEGAVDYNLLTEHQEKISEHYLTLQYKWVKRMENFSLRLKSHNDIAHYTNATHQKARTIFSLKPGATLDFAQAMQLKISLQMAYHSGPIKNVPSFDFYPMVQLSHATAPWLHPYIGIKGIGLGGSVQPLHLQDVVTKNPYIATHYTLEHYYKYLHLYLGSKGNISTAIAYHFHIAYRHFKNLPKIVRTKKPLYTLYYHKQRYKLLKITGGIQYDMPHLPLHIALQGSYYYNGFNSNSNTIPRWWYHKPTCKLKASCAYTPHPKLSLTGHLNLYDAPSLKDEKGYTINKDDKVMVQTAVGGSYLFATKFEGFLMLGTPIINHKFAHYTSHRPHCFHITAGIACNF